MGAGATPRLRVLIVEDSPTVRLTIRQALTLEGLPADQVWEAESARQAMQFFEQHRPDVVFLDITLPVGTGSPPTGAGFLDFLAPGSRVYDGGHQVARAMLARDPRLRIVICTGNRPDDPRVRELIRAGAFALIEKPVRLAPVREMLRELRAELEAAADADRGADPPPSPGGN